MPFFIGAWLLVRERCLCRARSYRLRLHSLHGKP